MTKLLLALFLAILCTSCTPFLLVDEEDIVVGGRLNKKKAADFVFNLFAKKESVNIVNEK